MNWNLTADAAEPVHAMWGADPTHVWIAGDFGYVGLRDTTPPNAWNTRPTNVMKQLLGMWAEPGTNLWIVGGDSTGGTGGSIVKFDLVGGAGQASNQSP